MFHRWQVAVRRSIWLVWGGNEPAVKARVAGMIKFNMGANLPDLYGAVVQYCQIRILNKWRPCRQQGAGPAELLLRNLSVAL